MHWRCWGAYRFSHEMGLRLVRTATDPGFSLVASREPWARIPEPLRLEWTASSNKLAATKCKYHKVLQHQTATCGRPMREGQLGLTFHFLKKLARRVRVFSS